MNDLNQLKIHSNSFSLCSNINNGNILEKLNQTESELLKSQIKIKKQEDEIMKLQNELQKYVKSSNNTSTSFLLPSEFKSEWESLGAHFIMESFEHVSNKSILLSHLVQETFLLTYNETKTIINLKIKEFIEFLGSDEKEIPLDKFYSRYKFIFQEHFSTIFCKDSNAVLVDKIIHVLKENIVTQNIFKYFHKEILMDLQSENIKKFIKKSIILCLYMHLHDPKLSINITSIDKRELVYYYFNNTDLINIEGFEKENSPCLVILPPPLLASGFSYQGIKPFVYIIADPDEKIMENCERHKTISTRRPHSKSYCLSNSNFKEITSDFSDNKIDGSGKKPKLNLSQRNNNTNSESINYMSRNRANNNLDNLTDISLISKEKKEVETYHKKLPKKNRIRPNLNKLSLKTNDKWQTLNPTIAKDKKISEILFNIGQNQQHQSSFINISSRSNSLTKRRDKGVGFGYNKKMGLSNVPEQSQGRNASRNKLNRDMSPLFIKDKKTFTVAQNFSLTEREQNLEYIYKTIDKVSKGLPNKGPSGSITERIERRVTKKPMLRAQGTPLEYKNEVNDSVKYTVAFNNMSKKIINKIPMGQKNKQNCNNYLMENGGNGMIK